MPESSAAEAPENCPLCGGAGQLFWQDKNRPYRRCVTCLLVFVPPDYHLSREAEHQVYLQHQNDPGDAGYRRFLSRIYLPVRERIPQDARGLDYGSGPGPTLSVMFEESGAAMALYDPFFAPDRTTLGGEYDFVTASEVVEHFRQPGRDFRQMWRCLKPGGFLGIMTKRVQNLSAFQKWHYILDPTHVAFFSRETFEWLAGEWGSEAEFVDKDVVLFRKK